MVKIITIYSILSFLLLFLCGKISYKFKLLDNPEKRRLHQKPTAYTGGIILSLIYVISIMLFDVKYTELNSIISTAFLISLVGFIDDKYKLNSGGKLSLQIIPVIYLILHHNFFLNHVGDYGIFKLNLGTFAIPFTLLSVLFLTNAFNYFDGLDGSLSFVSISILIIIYYLIDGDNIKFFLITLTLPLIIFTLFNFSIFKFPKLFLGDSGSLLLGFIIAFLLIFLSKEKLVHPILLAWTISIIVYDFIAVNIIRIKSNKNPFKPGFDHLHHLFFKKTKSILLTNFLICLMNFLFFLVGYLSFKFVNELFSLILFLFIFLIFFIFREKYLN